MIKPRGCFEKTHRLLSSFVPEGKLLLPERREALTPQIRKRTKISFFSLSASIKPL
jgi:hypothetical protein